MATYQWSSYDDGDSVPGGGAFSAGTDVFQVDDAGISAADMVLDGTDAPTAFTSLTFDGKTVTLELLNPNSITSSNIVFADGSMLLFGDNGTGTANDDAATTLVGGSGDDQLIGVGGADSLHGAGGDDLFTMYAGGNGKWGKDTLSGGSGNDTLWLADPESTVAPINANLGTGVVTGGDGTPGSTLRVSSIENVTGGLYSDTLTGSSGDNLLSGGGGNDRLTGSGGNDTLDGGAGRDTMSGGSDNDTYIANGQDVVIEQAGQGTDTVLASFDRTLGDHQENLTLLFHGAYDGTGNELDNVINGNSATNVLTGADGDDTINGHGGPDSIFGGAGNDSIDGGGNVDTMIGGAGDDRYSVIEEGDTVIEGEDDGTDTIVTNRSIDMADHAHVENLVWLSTGGGGGFCAGNALDNVMSAAGGAGTLTMDGNEGSDTVSFEGQAGAVTVDLDLDAGSSNLIEVLLDMENAVGGNADDSLTGNEVGNRLDGSAGVDTMTGGYGNDTYVVDDEADVVIESDNTVDGLVLPGAGAGQAGIAGITDTVLAAINFSLQNVAFVENLTLTASAAQATGNSLANSIKGNALANSLSGLGGNDTLDGIGGSDTLDGGSGNDTLVWRREDSYDGGSGTDTLKVNAGDLDLTAFGSTKIRSVEQVDLRTGGAKAFTLTRADVLAMSSTDILTVRGDDGDVVNAIGFTQIANAGGFQRFTSGAAMLQVETDVTVVT